MSSVEHNLVDPLGEDEAELKVLHEKPACFIIIGKPGVGKSKLARELAMEWNCVLVDDTEVLNQHIASETEQGLKLKEMLMLGASIPEETMMELIVEKLNSPQVSHYGYVLCCLPSLCEETLTVPEQLKLIRNLPLSPDFIINIKCPDADVIERISGQRYDPNTGAAYDRNVWDPQPIKKEKETEKVEEGGEEEEEGKEEDEDDVLEPEEGELLSKEVIEQLVKLKNNFTEEAQRRVLFYKDNVLPHVEEYMLNQKPLFLFELDGNDDPFELFANVITRLEYMAVSRPAVPIQLLNTEEGDEVPEATDAESMLGKLSSYNTVAPGFRWRRTRWGPLCPVALREGRMLKGSAEFSVGFLDTIYMLSSNEAMEKFKLNPRTYLLPPMPRPPCKVAVIGPSAAGKTTLCKLVADHYGVVVVDAEVAMRSSPNELIEVPKNTEEDEAVGGEVQMEEENKKKIASNRHMNALELWIKEIQSTETANHLKMGWLLDGFPMNIIDLESLQEREIEPDMVICLQDNSKDSKVILERMSKKENRIQDKASKMDQPEGDDQFKKIKKNRQYRGALKEFMLEWESMKESIKTTYVELDISVIESSNLLQEVILNMEKPFKYVATEMTVPDLEKEDEDAVAIAELAPPEEVKEDEEGEAEKLSPHQRLMGETKNFCPVILNENSVLWPCGDEFSVKYRGKLYYLSSEEARNKFTQDPETYLSHTKQVQAPPLRVFLLGVRGAGKTIHGKWLAEEMGIYHFQFQERLQEFIIGKTMKRIMPADEAEDMNTVEDMESSDLSTDPSSNVEEEAQDEGLTKQEKAIKACILNRQPLPAEILDTIIPEWWNQNPYSSSGFLMEGFPQTLEDVQYLVDNHLFPDVLVEMTVKVSDVVKRLLPPLMRCWREKLNLRREKLRIEAELRQKKREKKMAKRRAALLAEYAAKQQEKARDGDEESEEEFDNIEDEINLLLLDEFPLEEEEYEEEELEINAQDRLKAAIIERFDTDTNNLQTIKELLGNYQIPLINIEADRKHEIVQYKLLKNVKSLAENREVLFEICRPLNYSAATHLVHQRFRFYSSLGHWDPVKLSEGDPIQRKQGPQHPSFPVLFRQFVYFLSSKETCNKFMSNPIKYLKQPIPQPSYPIKIAVVGPPKSGKTTVANQFAKEYGVQRLSIGDAIRIVMQNQSHTELGTELQKHLQEGHTVPDEIAVQCLDVVIMDLVSSTKGFVLDGFPATMKHVNLLQKRTIIPARVFELQIDTIECLRRGRVDKIKSSRSFVTHDSAQILTYRNSAYHREVEPIRERYQEKYQNWVIVDGLKNKWWVWNKVLDETKMSLRCIQSYLERIWLGKAACVDRLCISPADLQDRLGEFNHYCPVSLALDGLLIDCSCSPTMELAAEYHGNYYRMASREYLEKFLEDPEKYVSPQCPRPLPPPHLLPKRLTPEEVKAKFPQEYEMKGYCPVTFHEGRQRYEALVQGNPECVAEYNDKMYMFKDKEKLEKFMRSPEKYINQTLPIKIPPVKDLVSLTSLPMLGYLEQGVAALVVKAMTAVGRTKPKFPFITAKRSAHLYMAYHLKAFNPRNTEYVRKKYKNKLDRFEDSCELVPYLGSVMTQECIEPHKQPVGFAHKLDQFLSLKDVPETSEGVV